MNLCPFQLRVVLSYSSRAGECRSDLSLKSKSENREARVL
jgi:hypothetical protein